MHEPVTSSTDRSNRFLGAALVAVAAAVFVFGPILSGFTIVWTEPASAIRGILALSAAMLGIVGIVAVLARLLRTGRTVVGPR